MRTKSLFGFDILLLLSVLALMAIGILFIYSSGVSSTGILLSNEYLKQIIWVGVGLGIMTVLVFTNYLRIGEYSLYVYLAFLLLLIVTLFFGKGPIRNFEDAAGCDTELFAKFHQGMLQRGIYLAPSAFEATFVCLAHNPREIDEAVSAAEEVLGAVS